MLKGIAWTVMWRSADFSRRQARRSAALSAIVDLVDDVRCGSFEPYDTDHVEARFA